MTGRFRVLPRLSVLQSGALGVDNNNLLHVGLIVLADVEIRCDQVQLSLYNPIYYRILDFNLPLSLYYPNILDFVTVSNQNHSWSSATFLFVRAYRYRWGEEGCQRVEVGYFGRDFDMLMVLNGEPGSEYTDHSRGQAGPFSLNQP